MSWDHGFKIKYNKLKGWFYIEKRRFLFSVARVMAYQARNFLGIKFEKFQLEQAKVPLVLLTLITFCSVYFITQRTGQEIESGVQAFNVPYISSKMKLEKKLIGMVAGYPIERMVPQIAEKDEKVAAFLVGIAKKESNWGRRVPVLNGEDCYNYWGFRKISDTMGTGGHTCFESPEAAVDQVADRIEELVNEEKLDTPREMVVWKCGYDCDGPEAYGSEKWISDVNIYFKKVIQ
jgi:hypothetical protein